MVLVITDCHVDGGRYAGIIASLRSPPHIVNRRDVSRWTTRRNNRVALTTAPYRQSSVARRRSSIVRTMVDGWRGYADGDGGFRMASLEPMTPSIFVVETGFSRVLGNDADVDHDERTGLKAVPTSGMSDGVGDSGSSRGRRTMRKINRHARYSAPQHDDGRRTMADTQE